METSQKKYTVESLTELIRQDPDKAFEEMQKMSREDKRFLLGALPGDAYSQMLRRAIVANLAANVAAKVDTP